MRFKSVSTRAPLRVGLAGGGTDIKKFYLKNGGSVVNFAIKKFHHIYVKPTENNEYIYINHNTNKSYLFEIENNYSKSEEHYLISGTISHFLNEFKLDPLGLEISIFSDAPRGSGLGSSSSLVVGLISTLCSIYSINLNNNKIADLAYKIERIKLNLDGGTQDQYVCAYGGLNFIEFQKNDENIVSPLILDSETKFHFESHFISFFTGISRHSEEIIKDQKNSISKKSKIDLMNSLNENSFEMKNAILLKKFDLIPTLLNRNFKIKKNVSDKVSNPKIDMLINEIKKIGVLGSKISGAGGGGFVSCYINPRMRGEIYNYLNSNKMIYFNCNIHDEGIKSFKSY